MKRSGRRFVAVTNFHGGADPCFRLSNGHPVHAVAAERGGEECLIGTDLYPVGVRVDFKNIERLRRAESKAFPLSYGKTVDTRVFANNLAVGGNKFPRAGRQIPALLFEIGLEEL